MHCIDKSALYFSPTVKILLILVLLCTVLSSFAQQDVSVEASTCYGSTSNGRLEGAVKLPLKGRNFTTYSTSLSAVGRTYVHSDVRAVVVAAYAALETEQPKKVFKYAETGLKKGGRFKPHKTHQNGLSVDFMVPVLDQQGRSVHLPTHAFNKFGYDIEFDARSQFKHYAIDYEALAAHWVTLHQAAASHGIKIWRIIFDPQLQQYVLATPYGDYIKRHITLSKKRSWVRHDEHYHVDFIVPCRSL